MSVKLQSLLAPGSPAPVSREGRGRQRSPAVAAGRLVFLCLLAGLPLLARAGTVPETLRTHLSVLEPGAVLAALSPREAVAGLSPRALAAALDAMACARGRGVRGRDDVLTLIDYSLPSTAARLWVLDLARGRVLFHELVAHGAGSGDNYATRFSNEVESRQSSLGLFLTGGTYEGGNGYSLKLEGLDAGVNDLAEERRIVMHGAWYVSADHAQRYGRLGRSWGCPALPQASAQAVIDTIKGGTFLFSYAGASAASASRAALPAAAACSPAPAAVSGTR